MLSKLFSFKRVKGEDQQRIRTALQSYVSYLFPNGLLTTVNQLQLVMKKKQIGVSFSLPFACQSEHEAIKQHLVSTISLDLDINISTDIAPVFQHNVNGVKNLIAVSSGKGGVGKSTTTVNLAYALQAQGATVAILDADVYGPSVPTVLGLKGQHPMSPNGTLLKPVMKNGIGAMSTGFLADDEDAKIWRGSVASDTFEQMITETLWGDVDYLLIDMPPGTGDIQLTLAQRIPAVLALIVTTPQDVALLDAVKGVTMFERVNLPILGLVENMSYHVCSQCNCKEDLFSSGGAEAFSKEKDIKLLGQLPLTMAVREMSDQGLSIQQQDPSHVVAEKYRLLAANISSELYYRFDSRSE